MFVTLRAGTVFGVLVGLMGAAAALADDGPVRFGDAEGTFAYRLDGGDLNYADLVTFTDGSRRTGKVMEWADKILVFDASGRATVHPIKDVEQFELRRADRHKTRPDLPDLTIAYIERLPRDTSWHGHVKMSEGLPTLDVPSPPETWRPKPGSEVTFRIHVLNAGAADSAPAALRVLMDGKPLGEATLLSAMKPGESRTVDRKWSWQDGPHSLRAEVEPNGGAGEIVRWNNTFVEPVGALGVAVVVARDRYEAFRRSPNMTDSFCFEDYVQYHVRCMNALLAASVYPSAPQGVVERLRCDRVVIVDDPADAASWQGELRRDGRADGLLEHAAVLTLGPLTKEDDLQYDALKVDWRLLQELGRQLGLVDLNRIDTTIEQCYVHDRFGRYAQRRHLSSQIRRLMYTAGGFPISEQGAGFLNRTLGRPRGFRGDYLYQLPERIVLRVFSNGGTVLPDVRVDAFQLKSAGPDAGRITGVGRDDPLFSVATDAEGNAALPDLPAPVHHTPGGYTLKPNPFGKIATDGSNGLLLLRLRSGGAEEFHFLELSVCNIAYLRGSKEEYVHEMRTRFAVADAPPAPAYAAVLMPDRKDDKPPLSITWRFQPKVPMPPLSEFRFYRRTSFGGQEVKPWTLVGTEPSKQAKPASGTPQAYFKEFQYDGPYGLDTFLAVTTVDEAGRESNLSESSFIASGKESVQLAVAGMSACITVRGGGQAQLLYWDGVAGTQPYGLKADRFAGYEPSFAGVAFSGDGRLVATDPVNHVLAFYEYDRHELVEVVPSRESWPGEPGDRPGEFFAPSDVAIDASGKLYVADRGNHRVQILDARGQAKAILDDDFRFKGPHAVGFANGHLCVTDDAGRRCRVYDVSGDEPRFVRQLPPVWDAGRGLVNTKGRVFITGRASEEGQWGVLVFDPTDDGATLKRTLTGGPETMGGLHKPRGLYLYPAPSVNFAYMVNMFPFDVRRVDLEGKW